jgi:hypothetical protein
VALLFDLAYFFVEMVFHVPTVLDQVNTGIEQFFKLLLLQPWLQEFSDDFCVFKLLLFRELSLNF